MSINLTKKVLNMRTRRSRSSRTLSTRSSTSISKSNISGVSNTTKRTRKNATTKTISRTSKAQSIRSQVKRKSTSNKSIKKSENEVAKAGVSDVKTRKDITRNTRVTKQNESVKTNKKNVTKEVQSKESSMRQMLLKESFSNHITKRLRPRKNTNNDEDTKQETNKAKMPIYKRTKVNDESSPSISDVYDFKFDINDSTERVKKKKKRVVKRMGQKKIIKPAKLAQQQEVALNSKVESKMSEKVTQEKDKIVSSVESGQMKDQVQEAEGEEHVQEKEKEKTQNIEKVQDTETAQDIEETQNVQKVQNIKEVNEIELKASFPEGSELQNVDIDKRNVPDESTNSISKAQSAKSDTSKPTIVSVQNLHNNSVVLVDNKSQSEAARPFRATNTFKRPTLQYKSMANDSLFNRSLSPIKKASESFDAGSPWRPPPLLTFSRVKDIVQSTPQSKLGVYYGRIHRNSTNPTTLNFSDSTKRTDTLENSTENTSTLKHVNYNSNARKHSTPLTRRFGTEITNLEKPNISNLPSEEYRGTEQNRETKVEFRSPNVLNSTSFRNDETDDKENATPKKKVHFLKRGRTKIKSGNLLRLQKHALTKSVENKDVQMEISTFSGSNSSVASSSDTQKDIAEQLTNSQTELKPPVNATLSKIPQSKAEQSVEQDNTKADLSGVEIPDPEQTSSDMPNKNIEVIDFSDPKPGPSGLNQKRQSFPLKPLRQTNLNTFLNIPEMPERTSISTTHGIFDDAHSTPISGKAKKLTGKVKSEVDNAFGFSDSDSDLDISPINPESSRDDAEKKESEVKKVAEERKISMFPARFQVNQIKSNLLKDTESKKKVEKEAENKENININEPAKTEKDKTHIDVAKFSDTFDVLSEEANDEITESERSIPLFEDLEPSHFTQPPKRSYKRKRNVRFSFSESGSEAEETLHSPEQKKKKRGKLKREDKKRLEEWVKSINKTFEEIDHYDLLVE